MNTITQAEARGAAAVTTASSQLSRTAAGAAALGAVFTLPVAVDAAVVYSGIQNVVVTLPVSQRNASNNTTGINTAVAPVDIDGNAVNDFNLFIGQRRELDVFTSGSSSVSSTVDRAGAALLNGLGGNLVAVDGFEAINFGPSLEPSNAIGTFHGVEGGGGGNGQALLRSAWTSYDASTGSPASFPYQIGNFANGVAGVAGVKFYRTETGQNHYGWIRLLVEDGEEGYPFQVTAIDWAWETDPETPFHYNPEIPEANPGLILLAAGGTGLAAWRLRRRQAAKAAAQP